MVSCCCGEVRGVAEDVAMAMGIVGVWVESVFVLDAVGFAIAREPALEGEGTDVDAGACGTCSVMIRDGSAEAGERCWVGEGGRPGMTSDAVMVAEGGGVGREFGGWETAEADISVGTGMSVAGTEAWGITGGKVLELCSAAAVESILMGVAVDTDVRSVSDFESDGDDIDS
jgi:hypothetical protein